MLLFGRVKKRAGVLELQLSEVEQFCAKHAEKASDELLKISASKSSEIKHLLSELRSALNTLENAKSLGGNQRREQIVETARQNTLRQLGVLIERLQPPPADNLAVMRGYCDASIALLNKELFVFGKNIAYTSVSFKDEVKQIGENFNELQKCLCELKDVFLQHSGFFLLDSISELLREINSAEADAAKAFRERDILLSEVQRLEKRIADKEAFLREMRESPEFKAIAALEEQKAEFARQKQEAKTEVLNLFASIEKPLHRMQKAVAGRKVFLPKQQAEFLGLVLQSPFVALKSDPKGETLKELLRETLKAVESGVVELKEKEREKRIAALQELLSFDFFSKVFWHFNEIDAGLVAVEKKLAEHPIGKKESKVLAEIKDLQDVLQLKKEGVVAQRAVIERYQKSQEELRSRLESLVFEATGIAVSIKP